MVWWNMSSSEIEHLAELLRALPPVPAGWAEAAMELPLARAGLDGIVARAEADAEYRQALVADLEAALAAEGHTPEPLALDALRRRLAPGA